MVSFDSGEEDGTYEDWDAVLAVSGRQGKEGGLCQVEWAGINGS
jgi:hypothetical protein